MWLIKSKTKLAVFEVHCFIYHQDEKNKSIKYSLITNHSEQKIKEFNVELIKTTHTENNQIFNEDKAEEEEEEETDTFTLYAVALFIFHKFYFIQNIIVVVYLFFSLPSFFLFSQSKTNNKKKRT